MGIPIYVSTFSAKSRFSNKEFRLTRALSTESALQNVRTTKNTDKPAKEAACCKRRKIIFKLYPARGSAASSFFGVVERSLWILCYPNKPRSGTSDPRFKLEPQEPSLNPEFQRV
ncbi:hypothetical protein GQX74_001626 [Glossina fuscipes]|nr:hypothetical protein GQX74_001626 [Glossina fuscipes]